MFFVPSKNSKSATVPKKFHKMSVDLLLLLFRSLRIQKTRIVWHKITYSLTHNYSYSSSPLDVLIKRVWITKLSWPRSHYARNQFLSLLALNTALENTVYYCSAAYINRLKLSAWNACAVFWNTLHQTAASFWAAQVFSGGGQHCHLMLTRLGFFWQAPP